ncbi:MAG: DUF4065 domain-containing protein [Hyphomicrobiales bacterium]|nr:DUF4065 domain-containing protein [Nitratireductor sp.]MCC2098836.1 DUF4065 domain-containing protein [Hyphomicrobiales bacterium]
MNAAIHKLRSLEERGPAGDPAPGLRDPRAVANYFIGKFMANRPPSPQQERVTPLSLQKLVFIAHALSLLDLGKPLLSEQPRIGDYDPYFPTLREALDYFGGSTVSRLITEGSGEDVFDPKPDAEVVRAEFDTDERDILDAVWKMFREVRFDCTKLTYLTGGSRTEFVDMKKKFGLGNEIPDGYIIEITSKRLWNSNPPSDHNNNGKRAA